MTRTALYRFFDADGVLLYVGITWDTAQRWSAHKLTKSWWADVADKTVEWFDDRETAAAAEVDAIFREKPAHNVRHATGRKPVQRDPNAEVSNWWKYVRSVTSDSPTQIAKKMQEYAASQR